MTPRIKHVAVVLVLKLPGERGPAKSNVRHSMHHHDNRLSRCRDGVVVMNANSVDVCVSVRPSIGNSGRRSRLRGYRRGQKQIQCPQPRRSSIHACSFLWTIDMEGHYPTRARTSCRLATSICKIRTWQVEASSLVERPRAA